MGCPSFQQKLSIRATTRQKEGAEMQLPQLQTALLSHGVELDARSTPEVSGRRGRVPSALHLLDFTVLRESVIVAARCFAFVVGRRQATVSAATSLLRRLLTARPLLIARCRPSSASTASNSSFTRAILIPLASALKYSLLTSCLCSRISGFSVD